MELVQELQVLNAKVLLLLLESSCLVERPRCRTLSNCLSSSSHRWQWAEQGWWVREDRRRVFKGIWGGRVTSEEVLEIDVHERLSCHASEHPWDRGLVWVGRCVGVVGAAGVVVQTAVSALVLLVQLGLHLGGGGVFVEVKKEDAEKKKKEK